MSLRKTTDETLGLYNEANGNYNLLSNILLTFKYYIYIKEKTHTKCGHVFFDSIYFDILDIFITNYPRFNSKLCRLVRHVFCEIRPCYL